MIPFNLIGNKADLSLFEMLLQCSGKLIGAGGGLEAAGDALDSFYGIVNALSLYERRQTLGVSVASAYEFHTLYNISVYSDVYPS